MSGALVCEAEEGVRDDGRNTLVVTHDKPRWCVLCDRRRNRLLWCRSGHSVCAICTDILLIQALRANGQAK